MDKLIPVLNSPVPWTGRNLTDREVQALKVFFPGKEAVHWSRRNFVSPVYPSAVPEQDRMDLYASIGRLHARRYYRIQDTGIFLCVRSRNITQERYISRYQKEGK